MKIKKINPILLVCLMSFFFSCNGPNTFSSLQDKSTVPDSITPTGAVVSKISDSPNVIFQDSQNNYWFGVRKRGVYKYDGKNLVFYSKKDGLCGNDILGIQEDELGALYFETFEGVSKYDGQKFTTLELIPGDYSRNNWKLDPNDLWFRMGWDQKGPFRYDGKFLYPLEFPKTEQADTFYAKYPNASFNPSGIYSLFKDSKGIVWFGTASLGVCRYDGESISWLYEEQMTTTPNGGALGIRSVLEDKDGYFWFTNTRYRYKILPGSSDRNGTSYINYRKENGIGYSNENKEIDFPYFMSIAEDNDGDLWMVTYDEGVWRNNGKQLIHYPIKDGDKNILLFSIYKDQQGTLWLITQGAGVYKYNGRDFEKFIFI